MHENLKYDVFLSHSSSDKAIVRSLAKRLRRDEIQVWFDEWEKQDDNGQALSDEGLEQSRILVLCISEHAFGSEWTRLESETLRFRDPLNKHRRFLPLRLDQTPIKSSIAQYQSINWFQEDQEQEYAKLLEACRLPSSPTAAVPTQQGDRVSLLDVRGTLWSYAFDQDGHRTLAASLNGTVRLWNLDSGECLRVFKGHRSGVRSVVWSPDGHYALSGSDDRTVRVWDVQTGECLQVLEGHTGGVRSVVWSPDGHYALSSSDDTTLRLWDVQTGECLQVLEGHTSGVCSVAWSPDGRCAVSSSNDRSVRVWDVQTGTCLQVLRGHVSRVWSVAWSPNNRRVLSGSMDNTIRLWDLETDRSLLVLEGHTGGVRSVAWSPDGRYALSNSDDQTVRLWDLEIGTCLRVLEGHKNYVVSGAWSHDLRRAFSGDRLGTVQVWDLSRLVGEIGAWRESTKAISKVPDQVKYMNAKVLLVGETGAGKTGLSKRLALNSWEASDSTVGAWATQWKLSMDLDGSAEREIWIWDFGGQADQRLIHQLYMDETALVVLVFDGQKEDLFETLGQWDRALLRASRKTFSKLLVAGRVDTGSLRVSRSQIEAFKNERGYLHFLETSAKSGFNCEQLKEAIIESIQWDDIVWRSSPLLFKQLKEEIVRLKDEGRVLMRFNELREVLALRLLSKGVRFTDEELKAVVALLTGPGVVWELKFGSWVLIQPERINAYAQAVIQTLRADPYERGCIREDLVLNGDLWYTSSIARLDVDEERIILLAMHQMLVERGLCLREHTSHGTLLVFPSYYRRERPELNDHPAILVSYRFNGFLDDIYATLVVRLHHMLPFQQGHLWRYAVDFTTLTGKQLGIKLTRGSEGAGELDVYFDPEIPLEEKIIFSRYVHEHLQQKATDVDRLRHYVCPHCGTSVKNREVAMRRLYEGKPDIVCVACEKRVPLWDQLEELFASTEMKLRVQELQVQAKTVLDKESKERVLVGEVISTVALAGQISREFNVSDHGIDMEIEFKSDEGAATGRKLYLQLKSGDSYLRERKRDGTEIFEIKKPRHADYWREQAFPVLLVIRNSEGEVRWMEIRNWLKDASDNGKKLVKQIVFKGERLDAMSVLRWRDKMLSKD